MTDVRFSDRESQPDLPPVEVVFGRTAEMQIIRRKLEMIAKVSVPVLIQGESGTGKELLARLIHGTSMRAAESSSRKTGALVKVSCPAIPHGLIETELFGYEKGAFTGANSTKRGRVEEADGGTLFLDEVGSLDMAVQAKLLQVVQDGSFLRVGAHEMRSIRMRVVTAANRDLQEQVAEGSFRLDLLHRINAMTFRLPPLRQRTEDLPQLVDYFLRHHARVFHAETPVLSRGVVRLMQRYDWPGNIRQLENLMRSYVLMRNEEALVAELTQEPRPRELAAVELDLSKPISLKGITKRATQELERKIILRVLKANNWNRLKTAKWLKISYRSLLYKLNDVSLGEADGPVLPGMRAKPQPADGATGGSNSSPANGPALSSGVERSGVTQ